jgi:hypothetical protein
MAQIDSRSSTRVEGGIRASDGARYEADPESTRPLQVLRPLLLLCLILAPLSEG